MTCCGWNRIFPDDGAHPGEPLVGFCNDIIESKEYITRSISILSVAILELAFFLSPAWPVFYSCEPRTLDLQELAKDENAFGTTFSSSRFFVHVFSRNVGGSATPAAVNALCACPSN